MKTYGEIDSRVKALSNPLFAKHFLSLIQGGFDGNKFYYLIIENAECNLRDMLSKVNAPLSRSTALQVICFTNTGIL